MKVRLIFMTSLVIACLFTAVRCFNHFNAWLGLLLIAIAAGIVTYEVQNHLKETENH